MLQERDILEKFVVWVMQQLDALARVVDGVGV